MNPYLWESGFPAVYWHTSLSFLMGCPGFRSAKSGDFQAARSIVHKCVKQQRIDALLSEYPDAVLLPVMTRNKLPIALAQAIGLEISTGACLGDGAQHKQPDATQRLLYQPEFPRVEPRRYILVDDIVAQGGTMGALHRHVLNCGGTVAAVVALACSFGGEALMPRHRGLPAEDGSPPGKIIALWRGCRAAGCPAERPDCHAEPFRLHRAGGALRKAHDTAPCLQAALRQRAA